MLLLRRRKYRTNALRQCESHLFNLEQLVQSLEFAKVQAQVFAALKQGAAALQTLNAEMSLDAVDKLMEESAEAVQLRAEVDQRLSESLSPVDDDAIAAELAALEAACAAQEPVPAVAIAASSSADALVGQLPAVPAHALHLPAQQQPAQKERASAKIVELS